jgi:anti-anti-sigma factor
MSVRTSFAFQSPGWDGIIFYMGKTETATNEKPVSWNLINLKARVDAGTFDDLQAAVRDLRLQGKTHIALDLRLTRFLSVPAIQLVVSVARELKEQSGELVLVGPSEKTRRHLEIYGSVKDVRILRSGEALELLVDQPAAGA